MHYLWPLPPHRGPYRPRHPGVPGRRQGPAQRADHALGADVVTVPRELGDLMAVGSQKLPFIEENLILPGGRRGAVEIGDPQNPHPHRTRGHRRLDWGRSRAEAWPSSAQRLAKPSSLKEHITAIVRDGMDIRTGAEK